MNDVIIPELSDDHDLTPDDVEKLFFGLAAAEYITKKISKTSMQMTIEEQQSICEACQYKQMPDGNDWCYMFENVFIGCKKCEAINDGR